MTHRPRIPTWLEYRVLLPLLVYGGKMFALLALLTFVLALFKVTIGEIDLVVLGLAFVAAHLLLGLSLTPWRTR